MHKSISWILLFCILGLMGCGEPTQEQKIEKLIEKLKVKNPCARRISASELGLIGSKDAVPSLIKALQQDQDPEVRVSAAVTLGNIGAKDAVPTLILALQDQDPQVRRRVAFVLGLIGASAVDAVPALIQALQDPEVRVSAAGALGKMGKDAVPALILALQNEDWNIRYSVAEVLERIGTPEALKAVKDFQ